MRRKRHGERRIIIMAQNKNEVLAVLQVLRKYNFKVNKSQILFIHESHYVGNSFQLQNVEELLRKEANLSDIPDNVPVDSDVSSVLAAYKSEGDPDLYEYAYLELRRFVDDSLDIYKVSGTID